MRSVIGALKLTTFVLSGFFTMAYQSTVLLFTKGHFAYIYPRAYHAFLCRVFGIRVIVDGDIATGKNLVYVGNHISYLDIEALGSILHGSFVAKKEVESWPFFGLMGKMQRTMYISRNPADAPRETKAMMERMEEGIPLIIFPEGTSSDGTRILPFKSSFFEIFLNKDIRIQPFTISVVEFDGRKVDNQTLRDCYAWYGDMTLTPHLWNFAKGKGAILKITFQEPIPSSAFENRKMLSAAAHESVSRGLDLSVLAK
jgi:1-acyl-sn-glycerol-3-phosphate acyltransferase